MKKALLQIALGVIVNLVAAALVMIGIGFAHRDTAAIPPLGFWVCFWLTFVVSCLLRAHDVVQEIEKA